MKKILIISMEYPPIGGGAGRVIKEICNNLKNYYNITLITNNQRGIKEDFKIIKIMKIPKLTFLNYFYFFKKENLDKYDKIIINDIGASLVTSLFFSKKNQKKCIVFLHGTEYEEIIEKPNNLFKMLKFAEKYRQLLNNCFRIIAVSQFMKNKFINKLDLFELNTKIEIVYNGIDSNKFFPDHINLYLKLNIDVKNKILLTVSRIIKKKGFLTMLKIYKELLEDSKEIIWIIVGDGSFKKKLNDIIKKDKLNNKIIFLGKKDYIDLRRLYSSVDLFWLLSDYEEALGLVYIEAQMCGCKVMGYKNSGVIEAIYDDESFFKDIRDVKYMLKKKKEKIPKEFFSKFTLKHQTLKLKEIIEEKIL